MISILCVIIGYCFGNIQTAYFVGKLFHVDIRTKGSGNLGTTNALRVLGKKAGLMTLLGDMAKAIVAFLLCKAIFGDPLYGTFAGLGVVIGHDFPVALGFKGGKGIASMIGMFICVSLNYGPVMIPICLCWSLPWLITGYVSLGSLMFCLSIPVVLKFIIHAPNTVVLIGLALSLLAAYQHRLNIKRLLNGTENRLFGKKKEKTT